MGPPRYVGPLGVMRSLGRLGVRVFALEHQDRSPANSSRYCAGTVRAGVDGNPGDDEERTLSELMAAGKRLGEGTVLIAGTDEWAVFVARHAAVLQPHFRYHALPVDQIDKIASKDGLYRLALEHGLPTPEITFPRNREHAHMEAARLTYPVMVKPVYSRPHMNLKVVAGDEHELLRAYREMEESPEAPNVMFQEYVPGDDSDVWIFNGYFDAASRCLAAFTGVKLRQHPAHMGIASLGELRQNSAVIDSTTRFMRAVGYRGIVDIGYRFDRRDGRYKVLDVNPRLGGAFRMFVDDSGLDVARAMYLDLTGHPVPSVKVTDGRRWMNEPADLVAAVHYHRLDGLGLWAWMRSLKGLREGATWQLTDPAPFLAAMTFLARETLTARLGRLRDRLVGTLALRFQRTAGSQENVA